MYSYIYRVTTTQLSWPAAFMKCMKKKVHVTLYIDN